MFRTVLHAIIFRVFSVFMLLSAFAGSAFALEASHYAAESRLASGHWVKIAVDTTGVYSIPFERLAEWGFENPQKVAVFGEGPIQATRHTFRAGDSDDLTMIPAVRTDDKVVFYAEADVRVRLNNDHNVEATRNYYDRKGYYFLGETDDELPELPVSGYVPSDETPQTSSYAISFIEREEESIVEGGVFYYGRNLVQETEQTFVFPFENRVGKDVTLCFDYALYVNGAPSRVAPELTYNATLKESEVVTSRYNTYNIDEYTDVAGSYLILEAEENTPSLIVTATPGSYPESYMTIDRMYALYAAANKLGAKNWRVMNFLDAGNFSVSGAPADMVMWDISNPAAFRRMETVAADGVEGGTDYTATLPSGHGTVLAFSPSGIDNEPEYVATLGNQNLHGYAVPEMLIVTTPTLRENAEELAQIHRDMQGLNVLVVTQDEIFNEFSSGSRMPQGIRRFIKMFYDRDAGHSTFRYVLLYGASIRDNRFLVTPEADLLVCYETENMVQARSNTTNYCNDMYFAMLDDAYNHSDIEITDTQVSIGRLPLHSTEQAAKMNAKILRYLQNPMPSNVALKGVFISEKGDKDNHFLHSLQGLTLLKSERPEMTLATIDNCIYPRESKSNEALLAGDVFKSMLMSGTSLVWYTGHGGHGQITTNQLWTIAKNFETRNVIYPHGLLATCEAFDFDVSQNAIAETMVLHPDGGAIALIAAGRSVYLEYNRQLNHAVAEYLGHARHGDSFADVYREARNNLVGYKVNNPAPRSLGINVLCYNFCGDPALPLPVVDYSVAFETTETNAAGTPCIKTSPLENTTVKASVTDSEGNAVDFNGAGFIEIFRAERRQPVRASDVDNDTLTAPVENELIATFPVNFIAGKAEASVILPQTDAYSESNRIVVSARSDDGKYLAAGISRLWLTETPGETPASGAPEIQALGINSEDFVSGDQVEGILTVMARAVSGGAGISVPGSYGIGGRPQCIVDGNVDLSSALAFRFADDGTLILSGRLPRLKDGRHSLSLTLYSMSGESASESIDFVVGSQPFDASLALAGRNIVRNSAELVAENIPDDVAVRLLIDNGKNTVLTVENPAFPYVWDLKDGSGSDVPDGEYRAWIVCRRDRSFGASPRVTFTVIRE